MAFLATDNFAKKILVDRILYKLPIAKCLNAEKPWAN